MTTAITEPTGLDYQAAYEALYPGTAAKGVRLVDLNDQLLRTIDRGARMRMAERERVKQSFLTLATQLEEPPDGPLDRAVAADLIRSTAEEIR